MIAISLSILVVLACDVPPQTSLDAEIRLYEHGDFVQTSQMLARKCSALEDCGDAGILLAKSYLKLRRWDDAIRELEKAVKHSPSNSLCHLWLGRAYGQKAEHVFALSAFGLARKVVKEFETSVKLEPDSVESRFDLMEYYLQAPGAVGGGKSKAIAEAAAIAGIDKRRGYTARARIDEHDKEWQKAEDELKQATQSFPEQPEAFGDLAAYLLRREDYAGAENAANKALALRPSYPEALLILSAAQTRQGKNVAAAEKSLRDLAAGPLLDDDPGFEEVYYWLGMACLAQGKKAEARQALTTALQFNPEHAGAKSALSQIRSTS